VKSPPVRPPVVGRRLTAQAIVRTRSRTRRICARGRSVVAPGAASPVIRRQGSRLAAAGEQRGAAGARERPGSCPRPGRPEVGGRVAGERPSRPCEPTRARARAVPTANRFMRALKDQSWRGPKRSDGACCTKSGSPPARRLDNGKDRCANCERMRVVQPADADRCDCGPPRPGGRVGMLHSAIEGDGRTWGTRAWMRRGVCWIKVSDSRGDARRRTLRAPLGKR
jgi:hypothetical protein